MDLSKTAQLSSTRLLLKSHESIFIFHSCNPYPTLVAQTVENLPVIQET